MFPVMTIPTVSGDWTQWSPDTHHLFINPKKIWEHPAISPLAQATRLENYGTMDMDSDSVIVRYSRIWVEDIMDRRDELSDNLVTAAQNFIDAGITVEEAQEKFHNSHKDISHSEDMPIDEYLNAMKSATKERKEHRRKTYQEYEQSRQVRVDKAVALGRAAILDDYSYGFERLLNDINDDIIESAQSALDNSDDSGKFNDYPEYDLEYAENNRENITEKINDHVQLSSFLYHAENYDLYWGDVDVYTLSVIAEPGQNLPHYVHDQLLFMNYLQRIVGHDDNKEKEVLKSGALISEDKDTVLHGYDEVISGIRGWWT